MSLFTILSLPTRDFEVRYFEIWVREHFLNKYFKFHSL